MNGLFNLGWTELVLIAFITVMIFGATRIKSIMKGVGEGVREFKNAVNDSEDAKKETEK